MAKLLLTYEAPSSGEGTVEIEVTKPTTLVAPAQVWVKAINHDGLAEFEESGTDYDASFHEYYHEWTINGEPLADWTKPENLIAEHNNPNKAFGRKVSFLLSDAGSYVIDLVVTDKDGNTATASTSTLTVVTPESHFPESRRIYVDSSDTHTGVPSASVKVATLNELYSALGSIGTGNMWVLFRRGDEWDFADYANAGGNGQYGAMIINFNRPDVMFSGYGEGDNPKFYPSDLLNRNDKALFYIKEITGSNFFTATGLDFVGEFDPTIERGDFANDGCFSLYEADADWVTFHDIRVDGLSKGFYIDRDPGKSDAQRISISDCLITNYFDYGIFGGNQTQYLSFSGNRIMRDPEALQGYPSSFTNYHSGIRIPSCAMAYIAGNDMFNVGGWSPTGPSGIDQPCIRLCVSAYAGDYATVERNCLEGGYEVIQLMHKAGAGKCAPGNFVIERNLIAATAYTGNAPIGLERSGTTIRTNLFVHPNGQRWFSSADYTSIQATEATIGPGEGPGFDNEPENFTDPIVIYSNTFLNLLNSTNDGSGTFRHWYDRHGVYENETVENNVIHAPNIDTPQTSFAPINTTGSISGLALRYLGWRPNFAPVKDFSISETINGASFTVPYASLTQRMEDQTTLGDNTTNRAYWEAIEATDTLHQINVGKKYFADKGHFTVDFDDTGAVITNASGETWSATSEVQIHLDRTSLIPARYAASASPTSVPLPRPTSGSSAIGGAIAGRVSPKDFLLASRGESPSQGALEPA